MSKKASARGRSGPKTPVCGLLAAFGATAVMCGLLQLEIVIATKMECVL